MTEEQNKEQEIIENETEPVEEVEGIFEEAANENSETDSVTNLEKELEASQNKINELNAKIEELDNRYLRLQADFDNSRRRSRIDFEASQKYRAQSLVSDLLPALDNFERALQVEVDNEQAKTLLQGMEMVYKGIFDALKKEGVEPIEAKGKEFDPHIHQAVMQVEDENYGPNIVVEELQKGYMLKDRVIRPAMVKVNQ